jgi:hypothetical protein
MIASIDWVTLHQKLGFILVVAAVLGALVALISLVTPLLGIVLKIYLRLLLLVVAVQVILGGAVYLMGHRATHAPQHYLYGAGMAVTLGVTFAVGRRMPWPLSKLPLLIGAIVAVVFAVLALSSG